MRLKSYYMIKLRQANLLKLNN